MSKLDQAMARVYANRIIMGRCTIDDVPEKLRDAVKASLDEKGWNWDE